MTRRQRLIVVAQAVVLFMAATAAVLTSHREDWIPVDLVMLLFALAVGSDLLTVEARGVRISGSFLSIVLAMALLGPAPAAAISVGCTIIDSLVARRSFDRTLNNIATWATFPVVGGLLVEVLVGTHAPSEDNALTFAAVVLLTFVLTNLLNLLMVASFHRAAFGASIRGTFRSVYHTVMPSEFASGLLTAAVAFCYGRIGVGAVGLAAVVLFVFQYLARSGVQAFERGVELEKRTRELASLQVGLLNTVLQTLSMRDAMTARHSAAVARYARQVARELGLPERDQELIHTAALLHDIGKFIFPDSILFADRKLTDEEWETVKRHPEQGAKLVRRIEGYGPVADIVLAHHERVDGTGYPNRLPADQIPVGSRIIAVADTYDVMTARDSYRRPVSREAAIVELRRVSGAQLDGEIVEAFIRVVESGRVAFQHSDAADFEKELAFDRRVEDYARPRIVAA